MSFAAIRKYSWDARGQRAAQLGESYPFAAEILKFYGEIAAFQKSLYGHLESCAYSASREAGAPSNLDTFILLPRFQSLLYLVESVAPAELAQFASALEGEGPASWDRLLNRYWSGGELTRGDESLPGALFARVFLQPLAEYLADRAAVDSRNYGKEVCPFCSRKPVVGILRPEGDGAKRSLVCSLCATEWEYHRVVCPSCGEQRPEQLPVYTSKQFEHVRIDACDACRSYIKTVDLTKNGHAVPVVDELATLPLTLWAQEKGYSKLQVNLLGM